MITSYKGNISFLFNERLEVSPIVPLSYIEKQIERDGNTHHITMLLKSEISDNSDEFLSNIKQTYGIDKMLIIGVGHIKKNDNDVFYEVVFWPIGNKIRNNLNLPTKDFHVTLGFKIVDIHDANKGLYTLIPNTISPDIVNRITKLYNDIDKLINNDIRSDFVDILNYIYENCSTIISTDDIVSLLTLRSRINYILKKYDISISDCHNILEYTPDDLNVKLRLAHLYNLQNDYYHSVHLYKNMLMSSNLDNILKSKIKRGMELCYDKMVHSIDPRDKHIVNMPDGRIIRLSRNFSWIIPDKLAGISIPTHNEQIDAFKFMNIGLVLSVIGETELDQSWFDSDIKYLHYNIKNYYPPNSIDEINEIITNMENEISSGKAVLVFCGGGIGRTGTVLACYILKNGLDGDIKNNCHPTMTAIESIEKIRELRPKSIETVQQENFIKEYCNYLWKNMK